MRIGSAADDRLTADDNLFVVMERVLNLPVVNQVVWRVGADVDEAAVRRLGDGLRAGRLSRLVVRTRGLGRDRWLFTPAAGAVTGTAEPVPVGGDGAWARERLADGVDSVAGPSWRLTTAPTADGGRLVSLVFSHVIADGGAVIAAVDEAVRGDPHRPDPVRGPRAVRALVDAASLGGAAARAAVTAARGVRPPARSGPVTAVEDAPFTGPSIAVTVDVDDFDRVAVRAGGTPNSLFVALVVGVLAASGRIVDGEDVPVELPVSLRGTDDLRANATAAASAVTPAGRYDDLSELRRACREAYVRRERTTSPMAATVVVAQALPDRLIARIADGVGAPLCLASGLGALPDTVASLGGAAAGPVMMRAATVGASAARIAGLGGGVSGWCTRGPAVVTICLGSLDPVAVPDRSRLAELFGDELAKWGLSASVWLE